METVARRYESGPPAIYGGPPAFPTFPPYRFDDLGDVG